MGIRSAWLAGLALSVLLAGGSLLGAPHGVLLAQTPASLSDEAMLSLVLPPLFDGSRPGVHLWARADQSVGPGGLPTVFVVGLYTKAAASGPEEHEIVNYVQYSGGGWAPARPRDDGTLLVDDWAWISLNLTNLTAAVNGQGNTSQYTIDYTASGPYAAAPRQIVLEEVYAADLSLVSSGVLSDTNPPLASATVPTTPAPAPTPRALPPAASAPTAPAGAVIVPPAASPAGSPPRVTAPQPSPTPGLPVR